MLALSLGFTPYKPILWSQMVPEDVCDWGNLTYKLYLTARYKPGKPLVFYIRNWFLYFYICLCVHVPSEPKRVLDSLEL